MKNLLSITFVVLTLTACGQPVPVTDPETGETVYVTFGD